MFNRKLLLAGGAGGILQGIDVARSDWTAADGTSIESYTENGSDFGFGTWEEELVSSSNILEVQFNNLSQNGSAGGSIARSLSFSRSVGPISAFGDVARASNDGIAVTVNLINFMNTTDSLSTIVTEMLSTSADLPVGIGVQVQRVDASSMRITLWYRKPGDANGTILAPSPHLDIPVAPGAMTSRRCGYTWQKGKIWAWYEDSGGGGTRTLSNEFTDIPTLEPWQDGNHSGAGVYMYCPLITSRVFLSTYRIQR